MRIIPAVSIIILLLFSSVFAAKPKVSISAAPATVVPGGTSTLTWASSNAISVTINNGIGTVPLIGSIQVTPAITTKYTITAANGSGQIVSAYVTVTVSAGSTKVGITSFFATPSSVPIGITTPVTLSWTTVNAISVTIDNNIGSVSLNGSTPINPVQTTTYILTAKGKGGSITSSTSVTFRNPQPPLVSFKANPVTIQSGVSSSLSWNTSNANTIDIDNGLGSVAASGSQVVSPSTNTIYTMTATNREGTTIAAAGVYQGSTRPCYAYVPDTQYNSQTGTTSYIKIIDTTTNSLIKTINVDNEPKGILIGTGGSCVYFSTTETKEISKIDPISLTISESLGGVGIIGGPNEIVLHVSGKYIYASGINSATLSVVDDTGPSMVLRKILTLPAPAGGLAVHPDGSKLYVSMTTLNQILVLDTAKLNEPLPGGISKPLNSELIASIQVNTPRKIQFNLDGTRLFISQSTDLLVMDTGSLEIIHSYLNIYPHITILDAERNRMYLLTSYQYYVINPQTLEISPAYDNSNFNFNENIAVHPDGSRVYSVEASYFHIFDAGANIDLGSIYWPNRQSQAFYGTWVSYIPDTISGRVTQNDAPLPGALIRLEGNGIVREAHSDALGNYHFAVNNGSYHIEAFYQELFVSPEFIKIEVNGASIIEQNFVISGSVPSPSVEFTVNPTNIQAGENATLSWDSTNAASASIDNGIGTVPVDGTITISPTQTATYIIAVTGPGGTTTATAMITVNREPPPGIIFGASPSTIERGQSTTLSWTTTNAVSAFIDQGIGIVPVNGSQVVTPIVTTTYIITAASSLKDQVTASATVTVNAVDTSAKLTGTVTCYATSQPLIEVLVSVLDASGIPQTASTDVDGRYTISNLRVGSVNVSFTKTGYDSYQQIINIPANTTFDLSTQLRLTLIGATLRGLVKDGQTNLPIAGATVIATYLSSSQTSTSLADGSYILTSIPLGVSVTITASYTRYLPKTIRQTFTQAQVYVWDFVIYDASVLATINGKITNAKTQQPEEGVSISYKTTNTTTISNSDGEFTFENIPLGEQLFLIEKIDFVNKMYKLNIDRSTYQWDLVEPNVVGVPYPAIVKPNVVGTVYDVMSGRTIPNAKITTPGLNINIVTDQSGNYSFNELPEGSYPFLVMALNHKAVSYNLAVSSIGKDRFDFYIPATTSGSILGIVSDAQTGETINSAAIEIEGSTSLVANSDSEGKYKIIQIPSGSFVVKVNHGEYEEASLPNISVSDNQSTNLNIILTKKQTVGNLEGTLKDDSTGNPISGAILTIEGTSITTTTDDDGFYRMVNVPAGLNTVIINATSYPQEARTIGVLANPDLSTPEINIYNIRLDLTNPTPEDVTSITINASEGGEFATEDDRFILTIPPNSISADAVITLKFPLDGPPAPPGSDLSIDPKIGISDIKSIGKVIQLEIAPVVAGNPIPSIKGGVLVSGMYSQNEVINYNIDEKTIAPYYFNGNSWGILRTIPNELIVDNVNNLVVASLDLSETDSGDTVDDLGKYIFVFGGHVHSTSEYQTLSTLQIEGHPNTNIKIIDKENLNAVTQFAESSPQYPNPNALPVLFFHGWQFKATALNCTADPNNQNDRYYWMINDLVKFTNGVYRPVFISYNPRARIESLGNDIAQKIFPGLHAEIFSGIPATNSHNPDNGFFPFFDAVGYSMGGIVARSFNSRGGKINNMEMIATPNHGTLSFIKYVKYLGLLKHRFFKVITSLYSFLKFHSPGSFDLLDYDDSENPANSFNPSLATLNINPNTIPWGDMTLLAGTDHSKLIGFLLDGENDSLVPVDSVFCRTSDTNDGEKESLLKVLPGKHKWEREAGFNHFNVCSTEAGYRIANFQDFIRKGLSDWTVSMSDGGNENNYFTPPTETTSGSFKAQVFVDYNVFFDQENSDLERHTPRDIDRTVLVSYAVYMDGDETKYYIVGNNADEQGNVIISEPVQNYSGIGGNIQIQLSDYSQFPQIDPNNPKTRIIRVFPVICNLSPGVNTVPLTPQNVTFSVPDTK